MQKYKTLGGIVIGKIYFKIKVKSNETIVWNGEEQKEKKEKKKSNRHLAASFKAMVLFAIMKEKRKWRGREESKECHKRRQKRHLLDIDSRSFCRRPQVDIVPDTNTKRERWRTTTHEHTIGNTSAVSNKPFHFQAALLDLHHFSNIICLMRHFPLHRPRWTRLT